jgi:hypothetical protein
LSPQSTTSGPTHTNAVLETEAHTHALNLENWSLFGDGSEQLISPVSLASSSTVPNLIPSENMYQHNQAGELNDPIVGPSILTGEVNTSLELTSSQKTCPTCNRSFSRPCQLKDHMYVHTRKKGQYIVQTSLSFNAF